MNGNCISVMSSTREIKTKHDHQEKKAGAMLFTSCFKWKSPKKFGSKGQKLSQLFTQQIRSISVEIYFLLAII